MDQMIALPMLLERGDSLQASTASFGRRLKIMNFPENCFRVDVMFQSCYEDMRAKSSSEPFDFWPTSANPIDDPVFPTKFAFTSFQNSLIHISYWASLTLLYTAIFDTHALLSEPYFSKASGMSYARPKPPEPLLAKYLPDGITVLANNICQFLAYYLDAAGTRCYVVDGRNLLCLKDMNIQYRCRKACECFHLRAFLRRCFQFTTLLGVAKDVSDRGRRFGYQTIFQILKTLRYQRAVQLSKAL